MPETKPNGNRYTINILFVVVGFLGGVGASHFAILGKVNNNTISITRNESDIRSNEERSRANTALMEKSIDLATQIVQQNTTIIQKILVEKGG